MVNFYFQLTENYTIYKNNEDTKLTSVFITNEDEEKYNDVNNWTISKIRKRVAVIESFKDEDSKKMFTSLFQNLKRNAKKTETIGIYHNFLEELQMDSTISIDFDNQDEE